MKLAIVGCGYVAEFYAKTMGNYPELQLYGAYDRNPEYLEKFCQTWLTHKYENMSELLSDTSIEIVLNLANPRSHYELTRQCLEAGKHVYSEKPLAMNSKDAADLVELANQKGVYLSMAPCSILNPTAQTLGKAIQDQLIGNVKLVYANFDDGIIMSNMQPWEWRNKSGIPWPAKDEFEVGCTFEHAGYVLSWLGMFFGPAKTVNAYATTLSLDKGITVEKMAPDFSVGCIEYKNGVVARLTCGLLAPKDKSITVIGEKGVLYVPDIRNDISPVYLREIPASGLQHSIEILFNKISQWVKLPFTGHEWCFQKKIPLVNSCKQNLVSKLKPVDFCRGPAELASAVTEKRECRLSPEFGLHIIEITEALQYPELFNGDRKLTSTFSPIPICHD